MRRDDISILIFIIVLFLLAGFGLSKLMEYIAIGPSNLWAIVVLIGMASTFWFLYMIQTDGFLPRKTKNDLRASAIRNYNHKQIDRGN